MSTATENKRISASFAAPDAHIRAYRLQGQAFADALGIPASALALGATVMIDTILNDLFIPIVSPKVLESLVFDFAHIRKQFASDGIIVLALFAATSQDTLEIRGLAPLVGVDEDPFTGRIQAGVFMAAKAGRLIAENQNHITTHQGQTLGRPGEAHIALDPSSGVITITGYAAHVFSTTIELQS